MYKVKICVLPKKTVLDPQGVAIKNSLNSLSYNMVKEATMGKYLELDIEKSDKDIETITKEICDKLLANPVMEEYTFTVEEV